jgi:NADH-quinone oxidoreductase subunit M
MPGSANFVGEFFILNGLFQAKIAFAVVAIAGVALSAYYALRLYQRTMHNRGPVGIESREIGWRDGVVLVPLVACIVGLAFYPQLILERTDVTVNRTLASTCAAHPLSNSIVELEEGIKDGSPPCLSHALAKRLVSPAP